MKIVKLNSLKFSKKNIIIKYNLTDLSVIKLILTDLIKNKKLFKGKYFARIKNKNKMKKFATLLALTMLSAT